MAITNGGLSLFKRNASLRWLTDGVLATVVLLMTLGFVYQSLHLADSRMHVGDVQQRTEWIASHTAPSAIVLSEYATTDAWYSGRKIATYPSRFTTTDDLARYLSRYAVNYVLVAPNLIWQAKYQPKYSRATERMLPLLNDLVSQNRLSLVYSSTENLVKIYQVN